MNHADTLGSEDQPSRHDAIKEAAAAIDRLRNLEASEFHFSYTVSLVLRRRVFEPPPSNQAEAAAVEEEAPDETGDGQ